MSDRYIRRFALPERLYTASAPVVLAAGVLRIRKHHGRDAQK